MKSLEVPSYNLAHALRDLVLTSWDVKLAPLEDKRTKLAPKRALASVDAIQTS